jgi:hypothetical protein
MRSLSRNQMSALHQSTAIRIIILLQVGIIKGKDSLTGYQEHRK